jgi:hyperosmotically inducible periplasmic protein
MKAKLLAVAISSLFAASALAQGPSNDTSKVPTAEERQENRDAVSGATLTTKVKSALAADVGLKTVTRIDVDSDKGIVTLKGKVDTADQKKRAEAVAKKVGGVKSVKNQLTVGG